jgi:hypothetical protein
MKFAATATFRPSAAWEKAGQKAIQTIAQIQSLQCKGGNVFFDKGMA